MLTELPVLLSVLELSSASQNTLKIRFSNWTPENGGGTQPRGYLVETRINGSMEWISSRQTGHNAMIAVNTILLKDLKPHTSYYVRVTPFIEDAGNVYYGNATQEAGPFLTLEGRWLLFDNHWSLLCKSTYRFNMNHFGVWSPLIINYISLLECIDRASYLK